MAAVVAVAVAVSVVVAAVFPTALPPALSPPLIASCATSEVTGFRCKEDRDEAEARVAANEVEEFEGINDRDDDTVDTCGSRWRLPSCCSAARTGSPLANSSASKHRRRSVGTVFVTETGVLALALAFGLGLAVGFGVDSATWGEGVSVNLGAAVFSVVLSTLLLASWSLTFAFGFVL